MEEFDSVAEDINARVDAFMAGSEENIEDIVASLSSSMLQSIIFMLLLTALTLFMNNYAKRRIIRQVVKPICEIEEAAKEMEAGSLRTQITYESTDEIGQLAKSFKNATDTWNRYIVEIKRCMKEMQEGNLKIQPEVDFQGDFIELQSSIMGFAQIMNQTMAENANQLMNQLGREAAGSMEQMDQIAESSKQIVVIIKSIEDIASQTNLLSLNVYIEAARAERQEGALLSPFMLLFSFGKEYGIRYSREGELCPLI